MFPNDENQNVMADASKTIANGFQNILAGGGFQNILDLFKGGGSSSSQASSGGGLVDCLKSNRNDDDWIFCKQAYQ
jgi:hypothetical protein